MPAPHSPGRSKPERRVAREMIEWLEHRRYLSARVSFAAPQTAYAPPATFPVQRPLDFTLGRFNAGSQWDVAAHYQRISDNAEVRTLGLGNGDGTFRENSGTVDVFTSNTRRYFTGDYNGDGKVDLFRGGIGSTGVQIETGDGNGGLSLDFSVTVASAANPVVAISTADVTGDGKTDIVVSRTDGLFVFKSNGNGSFTVIYNPAMTGLRLALGVIDVTGDGRRDLIVGRAVSPGSAASELAVAVQNPDGSFQALTRTALVDYPTQVRAGYFNSDSVLDLAILGRGSANQANTGSVQVLAGNGNGTFQSPPGGYVALNVNAFRMGVGDFDLDGRGDLAVATDWSGQANPTSFYVLRSNRDGSLTPLYGTSTTAPTDLLDVADLNLDGKDDVIVHYVGSNVLTTYLNNNTKQNSIRGSVWYDTNENQIQDAGEIGRPGIEVYVDKDNDGIPHPQEETTRTLSDGQWELVVPDGVHIVRPNLPSGFYQTLPYSSGTTPTSRSIAISGGNVSSNNTFGVYDRGDLYGVVYYDRNGNGVFDSWESGRAGHALFLDTDGDGIFDTGEPTAATDSAGRYKFSVGTYATYLIRSITPAGWSPTTAQTLFIKGGPDASGSGNFGLTKPGTISGRVYYDYGQDGRADAPGDIGIGGLQVFVDLDRDSILDTNEPSTTSSTSTDPAVTGTYAFTNLLPNGTSGYQIRLVKSGGYIQISPVTPPAEAASPNGGPVIGYAFAETLTAGFDFGVIRPAYAVGRVFKDNDADGVVDAGETGLATKTVFIDYNGNGIPDLTEPQTLTDAAGNYTLRSSWAGAFAVIALRNSGYTATLPSSSKRAVNFVRGATVSGQNFGQIQGPFSNAPYQPPINIPTGENPTALAAGDFNRDGKADIVVANNASPGQLFFGQGNGLFSHDPAQDFFIGNATRYMTVADLNADGRLDIIAANQDDDSDFNNVFGGIGVLLGNAAGRFDPVASYPSGAGTYGVAVADFTGDGKPDIVTANSQASTFSLLRNNGNGTFATAVDFASEFGGRSIFAGDINKDGKQDLVIANSSDSSITYVPGNGNGTFGARVRLTAGVTQPSFVTLADVNADTKLDLIYLNEFSDQAVVQLGNGNGTFAAANFFSTGSTPQQVLVIDVDRDGRLDLVVSAKSDGTTDISGGVSILRGRGDGTFVNQVVSTAHTSPTAAAVADYNGDGKLDIVVANFFSADMSLLLNGTAGPYGSISGTVWNDADRDGVFDAGEVALSNRTVFADVDSDGVLDPGERFAITSSAGVYLLADLPAGTYRIRPVNTAEYIQSFPLNSVAATRTLTAGQVVTGQNIGMAPTALDGWIVIDNNSAVLTGTWSASTGVAGFIGGNYLSDDNTGKGSKTARFNALLPFDGYYEVFTRSVAAANRSSSVPMDIVTATNARTVVVNQQLRNAEWISLGTYPFKTVGGSVTIRTTGTSGFVVADAIRFVPVPKPVTVTKDNSDPTGITVTGTWSAGTGGFNDTRLHDGNPTVKGNHSVTFNAGNLGAAGRYEVFTWYVSATNRASNARYDILTATSPTPVTVLVDQRTRGSQWVSLGYFNLNAIGATVTIRNNNADGYVIADAVQFVRVS